MWASRFDYCELPGHAAEGLAVKVQIHDPLPPLCAYCGWEASAICHVAFRSPSPRVTLWDLLLGGAALVGGVFWLTLLRRPPRPEVSYLPLPFCQEHAITPGITTAMRIVPLDERTVVVRGVARHFQLAVLEEQRCLSRRVAGAMRSLHRPPPEPEEYLRALQRAM